MDAASMVLFFSVSFVCSSAVMFPFPVKNMKQQLKIQTKLLRLSRRGLATFVPTDFTVPTDTSGGVPGFGTFNIPPAAPATFTPTTPSVPVTNPVTTPGGANIPGPPTVTNPATSPTPTIGGFPGTAPPMAPPAGGLPGTTPAMAPPLGGGTTPAMAPPMGGGTTPAMGPPVGTGAPAASGQSWCVAKNGVPEKNIQVALDYACGIGGADCSAIQQGATCYNPNSLQSHASYAFNSYYQKNPGPTSCDFGGAATITNTNPSTGSCVFPTSSSSPTTTAPTPPAGSSTEPGTTFPTGTTPPAGATDPAMSPPTTMGPPGSTPTSSGTSPNILSASSPSMGGAPAGFGANASSSASMQPFPSCIIGVMSIIIAGRAISL